MPSSSNNASSPSPEAAGEVSARLGLMHSRRVLPRVARAEGIYLWDVEGKKYLDGSSGAFAVSVGHGNRRVIARLERQLERVAYTYRTQFSNGPMVELGERLLALAPPELDRVGFVGSGSEAVEAAIKLARQYFWASGRPGKSLVISRRPSYHGATLGALSCTSYAPLNIPFRPMTLPFRQVTAPYCYGCGLGLAYPGCRLACAHELARAIDDLGAENVAAFIAEPIGGASTGAAVPPDDYFPLVEQICRERGVLLIIDDVMSGCGRTGAWAGYDHFGITPDIVAMAKGLGGGYAAIGAYLVRAELADAVLDAGGFMHGHTYAGNPLACAVGAEIVSIITEERLIDNARVRGEQLFSRIEALAGRFAFIGDVRGRGLLAGIELVCDRARREPFAPERAVGQLATALAAEHGLIIYPRRSRHGLRGDHLLIAPPLTIDEAGIDELTERFEAALEALAARPELAAG